MISHGYAVRLDTYITAEVYEIDRSGEYPVYTYIYTIGVTILNKRVRFENVAQKVAREGDNKENPHKLGYLTLVGKYTLCSRHRSKQIKGYLFLSPESYVLLHKQWTEIKKRYEQETPTIRLKQKIVVTLKQKKFEYFNVILACLYPKIELFNDRGEDYANVFIETDNTANQPTGTLWKTAAVNTSKDIRKKDYQQCVYDQWVYNGFLLQSSPPSVDPEESLKNAYTNLYPVPAQQSRPIAKSMQKNREERPILAAAPPPPPVRSKVVKQESYVVINIQPSRTSTFLEVPYSVVPAISPDGKTPRQSCCSSLCDCISKVASVLCWLCDK